MRSNLFWMVGPHLYSTILLTSACRIATIFIALLYRKNFAMMALAKSSMSSNPWVSASMRRNLRALCSHSGWRNRSRGWESEDDSLAWDLILAFEFVADHIVHPSTMQRLLGHPMFSSTPNCAGMSVFRRCYDFVD